MATPDDTSNTRRSRRDQPTPAAVEAPSAAPPGGSAPPAPPAPPRNLEEAVENARALLLQVRAMLHCLSEVLLYSDDEDAVMHAEVARAAADWINDAAVDLDLVKLKPLIEAIRQRAAAEASENRSDLSNNGLYQVREPRAVYLAC